MNFNLGLDTRVRQFHELTNQIEVFIAEYEHQIVLNCIKLKILKSRNKINYLRQGNKMSVAAAAGRETDGDG